MLESDGDSTRRGFLAGAAAGIIVAMGDTPAAAQTPQTATTAPLSNDALTAAGGITPRSEWPGARALAFDLQGVRVGCAEYDEGPTGCTVFHFDPPALCVADLRGGAHATILTDYLRDGSGGHVDAICLAGGSCYGLEAATGVSAELLARRNYSTAWQDIAGVTGAIIYDFRRRNAVYPDKALGRAALQAAVPGRFPLGRRGAGRSATCGKWSHPEVDFEPAGQGAAFRQVGETKLAVFTVVNAVGSIVDRAGHVVRGTLDRKTGRRRRVLDLMAESEGGGPSTPTTGPASPPANPPPGNTTLTVMVTNRKMDGDTLRQVARQVHASMARAIDPFHTLTDGDVFFAVTTAQVSAEQPNAYRLGVIASELAWDAVLNCYQD